MRSGLCLAHQGGQELGELWWWKRRPSPAGKREQGAQRLGVRGLPPSPALITSRRNGTKLGPGTEHAGGLQRAKPQPVHTRGCAGDATFSHGTHAGVEEMPPALLLFTGAQRLLQAPVLWGGNFRASRFRAPPARQRIRN